MCERKSGRTIRADRVVRDVFVKVRKHQQQIEHALALREIGVANFFFEVGHDRERIREKPFEIA